MTVAPRDTPILLIQKKFFSVYVISFYSKLAKVNHNY